MSPSQVNAMDEEVLRSHVLSSLAVDNANDRAVPVPLVPYVTNLLLHRLMAIVWSAPLNDNIKWTTKQRALAWVVATLSGGRLPTWDSAERIGQCLKCFQTYMHKRGVICACIA
mmetsp:Transcript_24450/g.55978  ORF Transcript_24450/g.55978 Transcript_24450/m.55978 type:complete len:114 (+) Transcript_24450:241-582(+)